MPTPSSWSDEQLAYLAGFLDGEGCFDPSQSGRIQVSLTDQAALERVRTFFGGTIASQEDTRQPHYKRQWHWTLSKQADLQPVLEAIMPHLHVKYLEAEALLALVKHCREKPKRAGIGGKVGLAWEEWREERDLLQRRVKQMRSAIHVLAVDPGERVGWARGAILPETNELLVLGHGIAMLKDMALAVHAATWRYQAIVYETFVLTRKGAQVSVGLDMQTSQFVGMVRLSGWINPAVKLVPQRPADMSSATKSLRCGHPSAADVAERISKLPKSHDDSHDGSALLHLWHYFFQRYV